VRKGNEEPIKSEERVTQTRNTATARSKIVGPEGYALLLVQDRAITGFAAEAGGYEWRSDNLNSKSIFSGDGLVDLRQGVRGKGSGLVLTYPLFRPGYKAKIAVQRRPSFGVSASMQVRLRPGPDSWQYRPVGRALTTARSCSRSHSTNRSGDRFRPE